MGLASTTFSGPMEPLARIARWCRSLHFHPCLAANLSTMRKPVLCRVRSYCAPGLPSPITNFIAVKTSVMALRDSLATVGQTYRQILWQASLDDLLLCFIEGVGDAIKLEALFSIVDHEGRPWISVARLANSPWIDDSPIPFRYLPVSFGGSEHFVSDLHHTLAQPQQRKQFFYFLVQAIFRVQNDRLRCPIIM